MFQKLRRKIERNLFGRDPYYQDPFNDPAEKYYARLYLKYLTEAIEFNFPRQPVRILDIGCHTGRLSVPLAAAGHRVTGIDTSGFHIKRAEMHARDAGVQCKFIKGDGFACLKKLPEGGFDLALCTEVLYQCPDYKDLLGELARAVRSGGLVATSHRTRFFYLVKALRENDYETARQILRQSEGKIGESYFNWQTPAELKAIYQETGLDCLLMRPVGIFSGNGGDGMAALCDLGKMDDPGRESLFQIEAADSEEFASLARYLLAVGRKRE